MRDVEGSVNDRRGPSRVPFTWQDLDQALGGLGLERGLDLALAPWRRESRAAFRAALRQ